MNKAPEHELQKRCVTWFRYRYPHLNRLLFAVPNGGTRNKAEAGKFKAEGVKAGVADLILLLPNYYYHSLNIEMKAGSKQSEEQKLYELSCKASGNEYVICKEFVQFQAIIQEYLSSVDNNILLSLEKTEKAIEEARILRAKEQYRKLCKKVNNENK